MKSGELHEKCALFGIFGTNLDVARLTYFGLFSLQHRGQESSGIAVSNGKRIKTHKNLGLVTQVYKERDLQKLKGFISIGHNRYSTSGGLHINHTQPIATPRDTLALAHNGNLPDVSKLIRFLHSKKIRTEGFNDSALIYKAIKYFYKTETFENAISLAYPYLTGAFCLLIMTRNRLAAVRDPFGIRPLSLGKINGGYVISSETCGIDTVNGELIREIKPGEMIVIDKHGPTSHQLVPPQQKLDIFEFIYFARPDSILLGKSVYEMRKNLGRELAREYKIDADFVIPVPDSAIPAAIGYSQESGIPFEFGLVKNRYIGRTFILPDQRLRDRSVQLKLNPVNGMLKGKRVIVIDDSIVRGTTAKRIARLIREAGAAKIHFMSSCPPVRFPDFYGIDTPTQKQLIAANMDLSEMKEFMEVDSLNFLSYKGLIAATELPESMFCTSCFTGEYPIDIGKNKKNITNGPDKTLKRITVLISNIGSGTNLQAIINAIDSKKVKAKIVGVISDIEDSLGLERARKHHLPTFLSPKKENLLPLLKKIKPDYIALAGWKQIILDEVIDAFPNKILNTHPGLIPDKADSVVKNPDNTEALWNRKKMTDRAIQSFLENRATYAGCSNHFLTKEFDFGPVLGRVFEKIHENDTVESLYKRLKVKENKLYVEALKKVCNK